MSDNLPESVPSDILAQVEDFVVWMSTEEDESVYHLELGNVTLHFFQEEWENLVELITTIESL